MNRKGEKRGLMQKQREELEAKIRKAARKRMETTRREKARMEKAMNMVLVGGREETEDEWGKEEIAGNSRKWITMAIKTSMENQNKCMMKMINMKYL